MEEIKNIISLRRTLKIKKEKGSLEHGQKCTEKVKTIYNFTKKQKGERK